MVSIHSRAMQNITGEVRIDRLVAGGEGLGHMEDGRVVFVPGTFPGDLVAIESAKGKKKWARAEEWTVLEPSPERVDPPCEYADRCGGCDWMGYALDAQRRAKASLVLDALRRTGGLEGVPESLEVIAAGPDLGWRRTVRFHIDKKGVVGFHARRTREVVGIKRCAVADPRINEKLLGLRGKSAMLTVQVEAGSVAVHKEYAPFVQANPWVNGRLSADLVKGAGERFAGGRFLELFCGGGNFTVPLGKAGLAGVAVEGNRTAYKRAKAAIKEAALGGAIEVKFGEAVALLGEFDDGAFDAVLLDPPRVGAREAMEPIVALNPAWIGYVSCDQVTLARDLEVLQDAGYRLDTVAAYDMFPHTHHVETLVWMRRSEP